MPSFLVGVIVLAIGFVLLVMIVRWLLPPRRQLTPEQRMRGLQTGVIDHDWRLDDAETRLRQLDSRVDDLARSRSGSGSSDVDDLRYELEGELARPRERVDELEQRMRDSE